MDNRELSEIFNNMLESGKISLEDIAQTQQEMKEKQRQEYLKMHPYEIKYHKGKKLFYCYVKDDTRSNHRRQITKKDKTELEDIIISIVKENICVTISDIFNEQIDRKLENGDIKPATHTRYKQVFDRHFVTTGWDKKDIKKISAEDFTDFIENESGRCKLDSKALSNLKGIVKLILKRAKRKHLIVYTYSNVFDDLDIKPVKKTHTAEEQVFTGKELPALIEYLSSSENRTVHHLVLLFMVLSGIRVGEAVALSYDDFISDTAVIIHRTETKYKIDGKYHYELSDAPKTQAGFRTVFIPEEYSWIVKELRKMRPFAEFLATNEAGERMTTNCLRQRLYRVCNNLNFGSKKSTHKLRKTFCSIILDAGFDKNLITSVMGHTDIRTSEQFYHFDRKSNDQKQAMLNNISEFKVS